MNHKRHLILPLLIAFVSGAALGIWVPQVRETNFVPLGAMDDYGRELTHCSDQSFSLNLVASVKGADAATSHFKSTFRNCLGRLSLQERYFNETERARFDRLVSWAEQNHPGLYCDASNTRCGPG